MENAPLAAPAIPGMAEASIRSAIAQLEALLPERSVTVRELWDRYCASLPAEQWVVSVKSTMIPFLARVGPMQVAAMSPATWSDYADDPETRERYSVTTRNIQLKRIRVMLNWAVATDRIPFNPLAKCKPEKGKPKRETEISREGEAAALEEMDPLMRAFFLVAIDAAMRREEIRTLEWTDVDFEAREIRIPAARTKSRRGRTATLTTRAAEALAALPRLGPHIFTNPETKRPYSGVTIWSRWRKAADAAGLKPATGDGSVRLHDARATAASRLVSLGAPVTAVQRILDHKSLTTTAVYIRVASKDVIAAYQLLEDSTRKPPRRAPGAPKVRPEEKKARAR